MSEEWKASEKAAAKIKDAFSNVLVTPVIVARVLSDAPTPIKIKIWQTMKFIILHWKISANHNTYPPHEEEIYNWVRKVSDE